MIHPFILQTTMQKILIFDQPLIEAHNRNLKKKLLWQKKLIDRKKVKNN